MSSPPRRRASRWTPRSTSAARVGTDLTTRRPWHCGQVSVSSSSRLSRVRLRVIWTRPSSEILSAEVRALSRRSASRRASLTFLRSASRDMSMKSTMMIPPILRRRSCLTTSSAASRLVRSTVSSWLVLPTQRTPPAEIAQAQLLDHLFGRFEIGPQHGLVLVGFADEAAGIDVDRGERFGLVENQVAARLEPDLAVERALDLRLDLEVIEDRHSALVEGDPRAQSRDERVHEMHDALVGFGVVV